METKKIEIEVPAGNKAKWMDGVLKETKDTRPVTERIKTFEDACKELGDKHPFVRSYNGYARNISEDNKNDTDILAYLKLRIICAALNEGWKPQFTKNEYRHYILFNLYTKDGINKMDEEHRKHLILLDGNEDGVAYAGLAFESSLNVPSFTTADFSSRICLKSRELAFYCGKQFIDIWAEFVLTRR